MNDAEKRLHKLAQKDIDMFKRAESLGLQVDHAALELYIRKNFLNQAIDHQETAYEESDHPAVGTTSTPDFTSKHNERNGNMPPQCDAANHDTPEALTS